MAYEISIKALEKSVRTLAKSLEALGLTTEIEVFRTGPGGTQHYGPSYVELTVIGNFLDDDGGQDEAVEYVKFFAGGYAMSGKNEIGGNSGWKSMAARGLDLIMKSLARQGWRKPT
jgi:hypothetical protein